MNFELHDKTGDKKRTWVSEKFTNTHLKETLKNLAMELFSFVLIMGVLHSSAQEPEGHTQHYLPYFFVP